MKKAKVITFGIQKGGSAKTTTTGAVAYLLSLEYKVLVVDMDSQGNLSELFAQDDIYELRDRGEIRGTVLEAMEMRDPRPFVCPVMDNLDLLAADDTLVTFTRNLIYRDDFKGNRSLVLRDTLEPILNQYDYILIDTPPALSELTINALGASDGVVVLFECSNFARSALARFFETIEMTQERLNPRLKVLGILPTMIDMRRSDAGAMIELIKEDESFGKYLLNFIIRRKAATGRLPIYGFDDNPELLEAVGQYVDFTKELIRLVSEEKREGSIEGAY